MPAAETLEERAVPPSGSPARRRSPWSPRTAGFLAAEALSFIGSWATMVAIWGYAAYEYGASPAEVSLFGIAFTLPGLVFGPLAGAVVDRLGPKATLAGAKVLGAVASLALLAAHDFRMLALLSALHGVAAAFSHPALQAMPPRLVDDQHLARTNALVSLSFELAIVLGPVAAGIGIAVAGFRGAFLFDAATYALGLAVLPLVRLHAPDVRTTVAEGTARDPRPATSEVGEVEAAGEPAGRPARGALDEWLLIARRDVLRRTVICTVAVHLLYGCSLLAEPLYVRDVLHRPQAVFAALQTVFGICLLAAGLIAAHLGERLASFRWVAAGVAGSGLAAIVYLGTPSVVVAFAGVALWGVATAPVSGPSRTLLQRASPPHLHGRVLAADVMAGNGAELVGVALGGVVVGAVGVPRSIVGVGLAVTATAVVLGRRHRQTTAAAPVPAPAAP